MKLTEVRKVLSIWKSGFDSQEFKEARLNRMSGLYLEYESMDQEVLLEYYDKGFVKDLICYFGYSEGSNPFRKRNGDYIALDSSLQNDRNFILSLKRFNKPLSSFDKYLISSDTLKKDKDFIIEIMKQAGEKWDYNILKNNPLQFDIDIVNLSIQLNESNLFCIDKEMFIKNSFDPEIEKLIIERLPYINRQHSIDNIVDKATKMKTCR